MEKTVDWTNEMILEFLEVYEAYPEIWNPRHANHKNRNIVHDAWKAIESKLSFKNDVTELKKKKESLMACYRKLLNKVKASKSTGSGSADVYKPDWFAYDAMAFLHGIYEAKKTISTENVAQLEDIQSEKTEEYEIELTEESECSISCLPPTKKFKKTKPDAKIEKIENRMDEAYKFFKNISQQPAKDECSLYTDLLCSKLRSFDEKKREIAMMQIDNIMFQLKHVENQMIQPQQPLTYHYPSSIPSINIPSYMHPPPHSHQLSGHSSRSYPYLQSTSDLSPIYSQTTSTSMNSPSLDSLYHGDTSENSNETVQNFTSLISK